MKRLIAGFAAIFVVVPMQLPASGNDAQIAQQIIRKLEQQQKAAKLEGFDIGVQVDKGTVTMMGQVADAQQALLALEIARRVSGVKLVVNDLYVAQEEDAGVIQAESTTEQPEVAQATAIQASADEDTELATGAIVAKGMIHVPTAPAAAGGRHVQLVQQGRPQPRMLSRGAVARAITPAAHASNRPVAYAPAASIMQASAQMEAAGYVEYPGAAPMDAGYVEYPGSGPMPVQHFPAAGAMGAVTYDNPSMPQYAWPSYASYPNYGAVAYPQQYSAAAWPYIGPFYPYPQVPLGWRKVSLEWDDGWWWLDFRAKR